MFAAYDKDRFVKSILIGNANPAFESLANISHYLQYAVLTSEDPSFFYHRGFIMDAFRESLIENIKKKRFVRGGSTISMQLVKNVFLSREKTISRKLQEILIVWLIENYQLVSKERMFEIYLNAIEWGPGIYGIKEAAHFYFLKTPAQLTLAESIFLASIIPHPKFYRYSVDTTGEIKPHLASYFKLISNRMLTKTWISPLDTFNLTNQLKLKGPSLNFNNPFFTAPADSLEDSTPDFFN
jgi:membrane peptidoglycan carboxypeptidase